jgi:hypothetical protein
LDGEFKLRRPNVVTIFLWITALALLVMTVYMLLTWQEPASIRDYILVVLAGSSCVTQIAVGVLLDMHSMVHQKRNSP